MLQLPVHLYFIIRIRLTNDPLLSNGNDENHWGFGQIYVLTIAAGLLVECFKGCISVYTSAMICICPDTDKKGTEYWSAKQHFKHAESTAATAADTGGSIHVSPDPTVQHSDTAAPKGLEGEEAYQQG
jgi:hypothetical protein